MCHDYRLSVHLPPGQRLFGCPYCHLIALHPSTFAEHWLDGHAYCDWCGRWAEIEDYRTFKTEEEFKGAARESLEEWRAMIAGLRHRWARPPRRRRGRGGSAKG